jgi:hypothetical protein
MVMGSMFVNFYRYGTSYEVVSVVRERIEVGRDLEREGKGRNCTYVRSVVISSCIREAVEVARVLEF